jgi:LacI family transcriptional regulator
MTTKRISIVDIAHELQISKTTVSFILNGKAKEMRIRDEVADRVFDFAKGVGYKPNSFAKNLRTGKSQTICLMVDDISNRFFANVARHIEDLAHQNGYTIIYCSTNNCADKIKELIALLRHRKTDGYLIMPANGAEEEVDALIRDGLPVVLFDKYYPNAGLACNWLDDLNAGSNLTKKLIGEGCKRIGFVALSSDEKPVQPRLNGYKIALKENSLPYYIKEISIDGCSDNTLSSLADFIRRNKIDALILGDPRMVICGLPLVSSAGFRIPEELKVALFDDCDLLEIYPHSVMTALPSPKEIADKTMRTLLSQLN